LFWHGGGMTGVCWETKPDGAPGWQNFFLRAGYDVYLCDAVERGRAGWSRYPEIFPDQPFFMPYEGGWHLYRIGPVAGYLARQGYDGGQFPVEVFDDFMCQIVPRWSCNNVMISGAYDELLRRVGPSVIVAHSQGGDFAIRAALRNPDLVRALVLIEPGGAPAEEDYAALADMPILVLWGDFIEDVPFWNGIRPLIDSACEAIAAAGGNVTVIDLPSIGVGGNSHLIMMDRNSDQVAGMVENWLNEL
jgi:pimeloyl-ACP methyl ester carboxylesterase